MTGGQVNSNKRVYPITGSEFQEARPVAERGCSKSLEGG